MKMEPIMSSETSAIRTQTPGNYPKRNNLHLEHGESLRTRLLDFIDVTYFSMLAACLTFVLCVMTSLRCDLLLFTSEQQQVTPQGGHNT